MKKNKKMNSWMVLILFEKNNEGKNSGKERRTERIMKKNDEEKNSEKKMTKEIIVKKIAKERIVEKNDKSSRIFIVWKLGKKFISRWSIKRRKIFHSMLKGERCISTSIRNNSVWVWVWLDKKDSRSPRSDKLNS